MTGDESEAKLFDSSLSGAEREKLLAEIFMRHRDRLRSMVNLRLDPRLRARIDPSDVLQEAYLNAARRLDEYLREKPMPIFLWLRKLAGQRLIELERFHLEPGRGTRARRSVWTARKACPRRRATSTASA